MAVICHMHVDVANLRVTGSRITCPRHNNETLFALRVMYPLSLSLLYTKLCHLYYNFAVHLCMVGTDCGSPNMVHCILIAGYYTPRRVLSYTHMFISTTQSDLHIPRCHFDMWCIFIGRNILLSSRLRSRKA